MKQISMTCRFLDAKQRRILSKLNTFLEIKYVDISKIKDNINVSRVQLGIGVASL